MRENHSTYQQYGPEPPIGNQYASGIMEKFVAERGNPQFDEIIIHLADDIREQRRRKEERRNGEHRCGEERRRDPDER
jgi:hypothetical protein